MTRLFRFNLFVAMLLSSPLAAELTDDMDRSPIDVAITDDETWVVTANETSDSISLIHWPTRTLKHELLMGDHPAYIEPLGDHKFLVSCSHSYQVMEVEVAADALVVVRKIEVPGRPVGLAVDRKRRVAFAALESSAQVVEISLEEGKVVRKFDVGRWPRFLALSPDGQRLGVTTSGERGVNVVDVGEGKPLYQQSFIGLNIGHLDFAEDGNVYFPWMVYRRNPITAGNIRLGWVLASRLGRFRLDRDERREAVSLDPPGKAIADPYGLEVTSDQQHLVVSASGTHELLLYRIASLPFDSIGGPDHLAPELRNSPEKFDRIELGGRPMGLTVLSDNNSVLVANYLNNSLQVVDLKSRQVATTISLKGPSEPSEARRGAAIFYDARRSLDQWYSCHSCHQDGGGNAVAMDTLNDGTTRTFKTVLPLYYVTETAPWTWHGWQESLEAAMDKSVTSTMLGPKPSAQDVDALIAFLRTIKPPPKKPAPASDAAKRGEALFRTIGCNQCHSGDRFTDGQSHDVGLGSRGDRYEGFNTPTLLNVGHKVKLLHDGRAGSLRDVLEGDHNPGELLGKPLDDSQLSDLIEYLEQL